MISDYLTNKRLYHNRVDKSFAYQNEKPEIRESRRLMDVQMRGTSLEGMVSTRMSLTGGFYNQKLRNKFRLTTGNSQPEPEDATHQNRGQNLDHSGLAGVGNTLPDYTIADTSNFKHFLTPKSQTQSKGREDIRKLLQKQRNFLLRSNRPLVTDVVGQKLNTSGDLQDLNPDLNNSNRTTPPNYWPQPNQHDNVVSNQTLEPDQMLTPKYKPAKDQIPHSGKMRTSVDFFKPNGPNSLREFALRRRENVLANPGYHPNYLTPTTSFNLKGYRMSPTKQIIRPDGLVSPSFQNSRQFKKMLGVFKQKQEWNQVEQKTREYPLINTQSTP